MKIFTGMVWCFSFFTWMSPAKGQSAAPADCPASKGRRIELVYLARLPDGLHQAALANCGSYERVSSEVPWNRAGSLEDLAAASNVIFLGSVIDSKSELIKEGREIETVYFLRPEELLKGNLQGSRAPVLRLAGGRIHFSDGSRAVVKEQTGPVLQKDHRYLIFATRKGGELMPTSTDQGIFELKEDGRTVHTYVVEEGDPLFRINSTSQYEFLKQVRALAAQNK